jgi:hypothetical protein
VWGRRVTCIGALLALTLVATSAPEARDEPLAGWFDLEVPGGETTLAAFDIAADERAFTLPLLARIMHGGDRPETIDAQLAKTISALGAISSTASDVITVPAPLDPAAWRALLPPVKPPATDNLFVRLVTDRDALLVAAGLTATDDSVRAFVARDRDTLRFIHQHGAGAFALVARRLRIDDDRVEVPGGTAADATWQSLAGVAPSRPGPFLRALVTKDNGRLAWYYDAMAGLTSEQFAAAWPSAAQVVRANALYEAFRDPDPQWLISERPFRRNPVDAWMVLTQNAVTGEAVSSPLPQSTWALLFSNPRPNREQIERTLRRPHSGVPMWWLARETVTAPAKERRDRFEMFRLAQRVFAHAPAASLPDVAAALAGIRTSRALLFTLERMRVSDPQTWAAMVDTARHVTTDADDQRSSLPSFQATIALLERMRHAHTIDAATATRLLRSLSDAVRVDRQVTKSLTNWLVATLVPALPPLVRPDAWTAATAYESTILQALAGPAQRETPILEWEGLTYAVDPVGAEHQRLRAMRAVLPSPGLDHALSRGAARDLADALTALVYATALGDPQGAASLSPDVMSRHQFGFNQTAVLRDEMLWAPPEERQGMGPWHVQGALLGLDLGLSRLFLRRIADQQMPQAPTLTLNDLGTLTRTGVALSGQRLADDERDEIAAAIARGRQRVRDAAGRDELLELARECGMAHGTRQLLVWMTSRQREIVERVFVLRDLLWLGKPRLPRTALDSWGVTADGVDGRQVLAMPDPSSWEDWAGRSELGQIATQVPDLTLRLIDETARLRLPAQLIPAMLAFALDDYWYGVRARFPDDWPRMTREAAILSSTRIQDYVAALSGGGPLRAQ